MEFIRSPLRPRRPGVPCVGVLVERRYLTQDQPRGLAAALKSAGVSVRITVAEDAGVDLCGEEWSHGLDVLVARGRSDALLATLRAAEIRGVRVVNTAKAIRGVVDKAGMAAEMACAGIPTPTSWLASPHRLAAMPHLPFPLVLKPMTGDNARGLRVVHRRADLTGLDWPEPVALAQEFHRGDAHDTKLYVAGSQIWAVRRPSPVADDGSPRDLAEAGQRVPVTPALRAIARACAGLFGLTLFGVDCVEGPRGPLAVEVNDFPNYRGIGCSVDHHLARVVLGRIAPRGPVGTRAVPVAVMA